VHFVIDTSRAERLRAAWLPDKSVPLEFIDCPDRRLTRTAAELVSHEARSPGTQVTAILPRRSYSALLGRLLHDRTADKIAAVVSRVPDAAATIIPFDVPDRVRVLQERHARLSSVKHPGAEPDRQAGLDTGPAPGERALRAAAATQSQDHARTLPGTGGYDRPTPSPGVNPIGSVTTRGRVTIEGRVRMLEIRSVDHNAVLAIEVCDSTGDLTALFYGRSRIPGLECGGKVRLRGQAGIKDGAPIMVNPAYQLIIPGTGTSDG
jgi:hypothetical protein